ncbi:ATP-binding protein [Thiohalocapsa marina]|uniref:ATP-binding protein n=1 Tax=Thiohalocapsa marina TaxID=424902 RepID=A0A5M8FS26_9GAMM|nr:ATP-binding protein [Thiohalocapsa marina]KAA6184482.1 ATP-binding protein [Thiohalocapsa marina]
MPAKTDLLRSDFSSLDPRTVRLARLGLSIHALGHARSNLHRSIARNEELMSLVLPLLDPQALANWARQQQARIEPATYDTLRNLEREGSLVLGELDSDDAELLLSQLFRGHAGALERRLASSDVAGPINPNIRLLAEALTFDETEMRVLDYLDLYINSQALRLLLREQSRDSARLQRVRLAKVLELDSGTLARCLHPAAALRRLGLLAYEDDADLEDFLRPSDLLRRVLDADLGCIEDLLDLLIEPAPAADWSLEDFPHLSAAATRLSASLARASETATPGINALLYGPPGTGKTEFARALAAHQGLRLYQVRSADEDGDGLSRSGRLSAYLLAQRLFARRRDALLLFDEVEDVFEPDYGHFDFLGRRTGGRQKAWINRILEDNAVPAIWITNHAERMEPAFLRRFVLPVAFRTPPRSVRRRMVERHLGPVGVSPALLDELAADDQLVPAQFGVARTLTALHTNADADPDAVAREVISAQRQLLRGSPAPRQRESVTRFDADFLNLDGDLTPADILGAFERRGRGTLCLYGPPGTGKTEFAEVLAQALDRELIVRQASDLISPYVGETEQNLAALFIGADPVHSVVLLDEVDSFLASRQHAKRQWERTQVNELLQQMERFPGLFIAATNLMSGIDAAALRRFDFKLHFRPMGPEQRLRLFAREVYGDAEAPLPALISCHLRALEQLTVGDVANVCRQRALLGHAMTPEQFLRRLVAEVRLKGVDQAVAA